MLKPKTNLYRNISITFIVFTVILLVAVVFFFSSKATIFITPEPQEINLSFNLSVRESPTVDDISRGDVVAGKLVTYTKSGSGTYEALSTKTVDSDIVGKVKIFNNTAKNQPLLKTTQLQADNGVIVRTNEHVVVPAGGSVEVDVFAKDPETFVDINPGNLVIIKLNPSLQKDIYGIAEKIITDSPREVNIVSESDITRAKDILSEELLEQVRKENNLSDNSKFILSVKDYKTSKNIGEESDSFDLDIEIEAKTLDINEVQLVDLITKKVSDLNLSGLDISKANVGNVDYTIIEEDLAGSVLIKVNYSLMVQISEDNSILDKENISGKSKDDIMYFLVNQDLIKAVDVLISPYWKNFIPKQESKIKIIINK